MIIYPQSRAVEDAVADPGVRPLRIFPVLWPLWDIDIRADVYEEQNYAVVDHYVLRCVAEAGLGTVTDIADFLGVSVDLARRCVRYLTRIKHVTVAGDGIRLAELGAISLREGVRLVPKEHRQSVLIDRFERKPLPSRFYDNAVEVKPTPDLNDGEAPQGVRFHAVFASTSFSARIVDDLAGSDDRKDYGLPRFLRNVDIVEHRDGFMPVYLIASDRGMLAYGPASTRRDSFLEGICRREEVLNGPATAEGRTNPRQLWADWIASRGDLRGSATELDGGGWRLTLSSDSFESGKPYRPIQVGTFQVRQGYFIQLWCADAGMRERAAAGRILNAPMLPGIGTRTNLNTYAATLCRQLDVAVPSLDDLRRHASDNGEEWKGDRIADLPQ